MRPADSGLVGAPVPPHERDARTRQQWTRQVIVDPYHTIGVVGSGPSPSIFLPRRTTTICPASTVFSKAACDSAIDTIDEQLQRAFALSLARINTVVANTPSAGLLSEISIGRGWRRLRACFLTWSSRRCSVGSNESSAMSSNS